MSSEEGAPERITGRRPDMSRREKVLAAAASIALLGVAIAFMLHGNDNGYIYIALLGFNVAMYCKPAVVVDAHGVRRPWRRRSSIRWDEVRHVLHPEFGVVRLRLTDDTIVSLDGIPAERSAAVAAIGAVPVAPSEWAGRTAPSPRPTERDAAADLDRRVQAFQERSRALDAEYRRLRGERPDA